MPHSSRRRIAALFPVFAACAGATEPLDERVVRAPCLQPAPLLGYFDPAAPGYIVVFHDDVNAPAEVTRLVSRYGFEPRHVYQFALRGFSAELPPPVVAAVRCEESVRYVEHDGIATAGDAVLAGRES